ncbi:MAG: hypothetical protein AB9883_01015 [Acidaminococcaceae bacterium]
MKEQYRKLIGEVFTGRGEGIGARLYSISPAWEKEIFRGVAVPLYDKEDLRADDNEAASFLISMPDALRNGAILCGSNGSQDEAKHMMEISSQLAEELEKARIKANIAKEKLDAIRRILVAFDCSKKKSKK